MELTVLILTLNEEENIKHLIPEVFAELKLLGMTSEVLIMDGNSKDKTREVAGGLGCRVLTQTKPLFGAAMKEGLAAAYGKFVMVLDADFSHPTALIKDMWHSRNDAEIIIASRYVKGGSSEAPLSRQWMSMVLNFIYKSVLSLPVKDLSSGFRLYRKDVLSPETYISKDYNIIQEILIKALQRNCKIKEIALNYCPRRAGVSHARVLHLAYYYLKSLYLLRKIRFSDAPVAATATTSLGVNKSTEDSINDEQLLVANKK